MKFSISYGKAPAKAHFDPLDAGAVRKRALDLLAYDMILPVWGQRAGRDYTYVYDLFREVKPDVLLGEYDNVKNWAGGLHELSDIPEEWFLHSPHASREKKDRLVRGKVGSGGYQEWVYDIRSPWFRSFKNERARTTAARGADLIWVDNAGFRGPEDSLWLTHFGTGQKVIPRDSYRERSFEHFAWNDAMLAIAERYAQNLHIPCVANISKALEPGEDQLVGYYGGALTEGHSWFAYRDDRFGYDRATLQAQLEAVRNGLAAGQTWVVMGKPWRTPLIGHSPIWPGRQQFLLACLLLVDNPENPVYFQNDGGFEDLPDMYRALDLGAPRGPYTETSAGWQRYYERGTVRVYADSMSSEVVADPGPPDPNPHAELFERIEDNLTALQDAFRELKEADND